MNINLQMVSALLRINAEIDRQAALAQHATAAHAQMVRDYFSVKIGWGIPSMGQKRRWANARKA